MTPKKLHSLIWIPLLLCILRDKELTLQLVPLVLAGTAVDILLASNEYQLEVVEGELEKKQPY